MSLTYSANSMKLRDCPESSSRLGGQKSHLWIVTTIDESASLRTLLVSALDLQDGVGLRGVFACCRTRVVPGSL